MHSLALQQVRNLLGHEPDDFLVIFVVFCVEELVEGEDERPASIVVFLDDLGDTLCQPSVEFSNLHVVGEIDAADVVDALKCIFCCLVIGDEVGVWLDDVQTDVLPYLHVHLLYV